MVSMTTKDKQLITLKEILAVSRVISPYFSFQVSPFLSTNSKSRSTTNFTDWRKCSKLQMRIPSPMTA